MTDYIKQPALQLSNFLNDHYKDVPPAKIILYTAGASLMVAYIYGQLTHKVKKPTYYLIISVIIA